MISDRPDIFRRKIEIQKTIDSKLERARKQKEAQRLHGERAKKRKNFNFFKKCLKLGNQNYQRNLWLFDMHQQEVGANMKVKDANISLYL